MAATERAARADGELEWTQPFVETARVSNLLWTDSGIYVACTEADSLVVYKFDSEGEQLWRQVTMEIAAVRILAGKNDDVVVFATSDGVSHELHFSSDSGALLDSRELMSGPTLQDVALDPAGGYPFSGVTSSKAFNAFGAREVITPYLNGVSSMFIISITEEYKGRWSLIAGQGNSDTYNSGISVMPDGRVLTAGRVHHSVSQPFFKVRGTSITAPRLGYAMSLDPSDFR